MDDEKITREEALAGRKWGGVIGVIVHMGLYSVPAFDSVESAEHRGIQNGSEHYLGRLLAKGTDFRPTSGWRETQLFHARQFGASFKYTDFAKSFTLDKWAPDEWMRVFKSAGATYAILTAKHHDGFCLWPTKTNNLHVKSPSSAAQKDVVALFKAAAQKAGLRFGLYYSWSEFGQGATKEYMTRVVQPQISELIAYAPDIFWFDGDWACKTQFCQTVIDGCCRKIRQRLPKTVLINDRIGRKTERVDPNYLGLADYRVYADRAIPEHKPTVRWEHVNTIGLSWGRNKQQKDHHYKSGVDLYQLYETVRNLGGNFLINVGPDADGTICAQEIGALTRFGQEIVRWQSADPPTTSTAAAQVAHSSTTGSATATGVGMSASKPSDQSESDKSGFQAARPSPSTVADGEALKSTSTDFKKSAPGKRIGDKRPHDLS